MISTDRLILRPPVEADFPAIARLFADPEVVRHIGNGQTQPRHESFGRLLRDAGHWHLMGYGLFSLIDRATGSYIGKAGFARFERDLGPLAATGVEAAWMLDPAWHGQGLALEAMRAAQGWFDRQVGLDTACIIDPDNVPSVRLATKLGYAHAGDIPYAGHAVGLYLRKAQA